eukprot:CAMPEP_0114437546 /NCGR_PEP_ID=MMETSP0103-20121206/14073_1 /TAXON_ID=37642 ORGANISM="Paraphysomonas imperforata, Strain PA2" /NCGR_SAMPLE_ID=MMETSP0103 /ASSEMBLY_ACC=CAM_ASM_000201 /LENGTH=72 /DNA_ID=CAMNT_0001607949 /DNA_START=11 /DNA_END=225 /DNA_ORIENTATION=-
MVVTGGATLTFSEGGAAAASAGVELCDGTVVFDTQTFNMSTTTALANECGLGAATLVYDGGSHVSTSDLRNV